jgi:hypothetical protein
MRSRMNRNLIDETFTSGFNKKFNQTWNFAVFGGIVWLMVKLAVVGLLIWGGIWFVGEVREHGLKDAATIIWEGPKESANVLESTE